MPATTSAKRTAADVMTPDPRTCSVFSTVLEAVLIFRDADCGAVPVIEEAKPVGILTDRDVALAVARFPSLQGVPVSEIMTRDVVTIPADTRLDEVGARFAGAKVRRLLVTDEAGLVSGIVSLSDLATNGERRGAGAALGRIARPGGQHSQTLH